VRKDTLIKFGGKSQQSEPAILNNQQVGCSSMNIPRRMLHARQKTNKTNLLFLADTSKSTKWLSENYNINKYCFTATTKNNNLQ